MKHTPGTMRGRIGRRSIALIATAAAAALAFTGCSASNTSGSSNADLKGQTISYWLWDTNQQPAYQQCAADFTKKTGINVKISQYGWADYWTKLTTGFASGTAPDTFADHLNYFLQFEGQGQLLDITKQVKSANIDLAQYQPGLADLWVKDGKRYGLPKDFDTVGVFYNEDMIKAAGYTDAQMKTLEWNTNDGGSYEKLLAKLTIDKNGVHGDQPGFDKNNVAVYGLGLSSAAVDAVGQQGWAPYALSNDWNYGNKTPGTTKFNYGDSKFTGALTWWRSLIQKGYMEPLPQALSETDPSTGYLGGKYAMVTDGDWMNTTYLGQDKVPTKVAPTPVGPSGKRASVFNGLSDGIWSGTKHADAAFQWVKYLGSSDCQDVVASKAVVFPAIKTATAKAVEQFKAKGWDVSGFTVQVDDKTTKLLPIADHWSDVQSIMTAALQSYLSGKGTVDDIVKAGDQVNALYK